MTPPVSLQPSHLPPRPRGFERPVSLSDVLDRLLNKGVVVAGEVVITLAGVDLVYLGLNVLLSSVETARTGSSAREATGDAS
jgi:gas vesicle structural protein